LAFSVAARTVLELGAELISSDEIALYELVKNAFDAGSPNVEIEFHVRLRRTEYEALAILLVELTPAHRASHPDESRNTAGDFQSTRQSIAKRFEEVTGDKELAKRMEQAETREALLELTQGAYDNLNEIIIRDTGEGMKESVLKGAFLTIGTAHRLEQRRNRSVSLLRQPLGEKGVGRLSAMRLGSKLHVRTGSVGETRWNTLKIDWTLFGRYPAQMVGDVPVIVGPGEPKRPETSGTTLTISGLESDWTADKLRKIATKEFSRLSDPFLSRSRTFPIKLTFNGTLVPLERLSSDLFKAAHGYCSGRYTVADEPRFEADFEYRLYNEKTSFTKGPSEMRDAITDQVPSSALKTLGPFKFEFYWFNRQALKAIDSIGNITAVRNLVNSWSGGLMVFRDDFRVNPYGRPGDDWLELNRQAFRSGGYLLNTDQIIGRLKISAENNPRLVDQTNREGLRNTFEF
jgi:hypothetical protein